MCGAGVDDSARAFVIQRLIAGEVGDVEDVIDGRLKGLALGMLGRVEINGKAVFVGAANAEGEIALDGDAQHVGVDRRSVQAIENVDAVAQHVDVRCTLQEIGLGRFGGSDGTVVCDGVGHDVIIALSAGWLIGGHFPTRCGRTGSGFVLVGAAFDLGSDGLHDSHTIIRVLDHEGGQEV